MNDPSGSGAIAHRTTRSSSASQPAYPGFSISLTSSPEARCSRYTSCSCGLSALIPTSTSSGRRFDVPMIVAWIPSNGVRSRRSSDSGSTSYSRQFSSPPTSCTYSTCRPSRAHANARMPRSVSSVTGRAAVQSTPDSPPIGATHRFSTPSRGAIQASAPPSGEICGLVRSGLPKSTLRGMRSTMRQCLSHAGNQCGTRGEPARNARGSRPDPQVTGVFPGRSASRYTLITVSGARTSLSGWLAQDGLRRRPQGRARARRPRHHQRGPPGARRCRPGRRPGPRAGRPGAGRRAGPRPDRGAVGGPGAPRRGCPPSSASARPWPTTWSATPRTSPCCAARRRAAAWTRRRSARSSSAPWRADPDDAEPGGGPGRGAARPSAAAASSRSAPAPTPRGSWPPPTTAGSCTSRPAT